MLKPFTLTFIAAALVAGTAQAGDYLSVENGFLRTASGDCVRTGSWSSTSGECGAKPQAAAPTVPPARVTAEAQVFFAFDRFELDADARQELDRLMDTLRQAGVHSVRTVGHADPIGTELYNQRLSERRAEAVREYLVSKGWPVDAITVEGKGEGGANPERRVDVGVLAVERPLAKTAKAEVPSGE